MAYFRIGSSASFDNIPSTLFWENDSPSSSFSPRVGDNKIWLKTDTNILYALIGVAFQRKNNDTETIRVYQKPKVGSTMWAAAATGKDVGDVSRRFKVDMTEDNTNNGGRYSYSIQIGVARYYNTSASSAASGPTTNNYYLIPLKIWGIK